VSSQVANQSMNVKVEEVWTVQEEEVRMPITWQTIKAEHEVSCMSVLPSVRKCNRAIELPVILLVSISLPVSPSTCPHENILFVEGILNSPIGAGSCLSVIVCGWKLLVLYCFHFMGI
jgi:hypothetical protein